ncbi:K02A2.6-like, partial [Cordylochernes scorpioides]
MHLGMSSSASPGSSGSAEQEPGRPSIPSPTGGRISSENGNQKIILKENSENQVHANPPAGVEDLSPGAEDDFNVVKTKKRRRESSNSPTAAAPSSNSGGARSSRRLHSSARSVPRAQEIPTTRTHITEARARQASSSEEPCVYLEHGPELQPFHYLRALDRLLVGTAGIIQISKVNSHQLLGLANRGLAERLINNGIEVEGTLLRAFPFRKRTERITVSNLPFFVEDSAIINALRPFGRITSIAPKMMKAGPYTDGRREAFIVLHEGMTTERLPTRLDITIKGEAWPAYLSTGIKCSRCHGQGHRRANCPLLAELANNTRTAPPTTPTGVPPPTTPAPPQRSAAQPPAPAPSGPAMEVVSDCFYCKYTTYLHMVQAMIILSLETSSPVPPTDTAECSSSQARLYLLDGTYFKSLLEEFTGNKITALCMKCPRDVLTKIKGYHNCTSNFLSYLKRKHGQECIEEYKRYVKKKKSEVKTEKSNENKITQEQFDENILKYFIHSMIPLRAVEDPYFSKIFTDLEISEMGLTLMSRRSLGRIENHYETQVAKIKSKLKEASYVCTEIDIWSSKKRSFIGVTAHWITNDLRRVSVALACQRFKGVHSYNRLSDIIQEINDHFDLNRNKIVASVTDNGSNFVKAFKMFDVKLTNINIVDEVKPPSDYTVTFKVGRPDHRVVHRTMDIHSFYSCDDDDEVHVVGHDNHGHDNPVSDGFYCKYTTCLHSAVRPRVARAPEFFASGGRKLSRMATNFIRAESPSKAVQKPVRHSIQAQTCAELSAKEDLQRKISNNLSAKQNDANPPTGVKDANLAAARGDVTTGSAAATSSNAAARVLGSWADSIEDQGPGEDDDFTVIKSKKRRRDSPGSPAAAAPSSGTRGAGATRRPRSSTGWAPPAGPYVYNDGRREAFIILREGMTIERLPTRLDISIKGEAWPAYLSSGIKCSRCRGQGHRRANCPLLAGRTTAPGPATPTSPTSVPPATAPRLPQQPSAQPPPPASPSSTMEVSDVPPASRAAPLPPAALQPSPPAPSALPVEDAPPAPPPVTPAPSLRTPGSHEPAAPTPDVEMSIAEETSASSTSSAKNSTRVDLDAFIEKHPSVSFAGTDALGLGREEVLDLLSSRTKAQRKGPLLSPPQCDALAGLIGQILDLRPGAASNLYKVLGQVKAELRTTPAVPPTPPLPAPRPAETAPSAPQGEESAPAEVAYPPPLPVKMTDEARKKWLLDLFKELNYKTFLVPLLGWTRPEQIIHAALHSGEERNDILGAHPDQRSILANFLGSVIERARGVNKGCFIVIVTYLHMVQAMIILSNFSNNQEAFDKYANLPAGGKDANLAAPFNLAATPSSNAVAQAQRNWADMTEDINPEIEDNFTLVQRRKRRRGSANSPTANAPSSNPRPRALPLPKGTGQNGRRNRRSRPGFQGQRTLPAGTNRGLVERLISEGLEVEGTLLKAFPFRKRAERITVGNLPFFVADSVIINALSTFGRVTSIAPKLMKAGPYIYNDGRREAFIALHEGVTIERLPTRLEIKIKGETWPAYLTSGIRCSRCHGQGHPRAICPLLAGLANNTRMAPPTTPAGVPPPTTPAPPQRSAAQPPAPASSDPALETPGAPPEARAVTTSTAPRPSPPVAPAVPMEEAPSAPPPVTPAPSLQAPEGPVGPRPANSQHPEPPPARQDFVAPRGPLPAQRTLGPAAPTPDVEMSIVEETSASSTSTAKNATRVDLDEFIERHPTVSFARKDALGLGREEVLDLLSSRTKAQRKGPLLSPPQCDALAGLIVQILDLRPGAASNLYKVLGQVKAELRTTPTAVPPTPPLPAPQPAGTTPPAPPDEESTLLMQEETMIVEIFSKLKHTTCLRPLYQSGIHFSELMDAVLCHDDRMALMAKLSPALKIVLAEFLGAAIEQAQDCHPNLATALTVSTPHVYTRPCGHASRELPSFSPLASGITSRMATNLARADSPSKAEQKPARHGSLAHPCAELSANQDLQNEIPIALRKKQNYVNPPAGSQDANSAAPVDLAAVPTSNAAAQVRRNWADITEEVNPGAEEGFTLVQGRKRRRGSANSPTAAAPSSNAGGSRTIRRPQPSARSVPRAQEIPTTRTHITEARARQASSSEEHCVYLEHGPELQPFHYLRALDRLLGGTAGIIQISKVNGHQLLGLANRGLAERLINNGLEVEGTLLRAFPFRKRAERITVSNLPFFVEDSAIINALRPFGRITSIAPKMMKAGPYTYTDGRREAFIVLHEGMTTERLPTRLNITIKGEAWPAYLSTGIKCSRCHGQGHRRANCPLVAGLANNTRTAPPTTPAGVPPPTTPAPPQRSAAQLPAPTPSNPAMEVCSAPPVARAALHSSAPRPSPPAAPAFPMEETPPAPPPVTPAPSLRTPGSREPAAQTQDVEMPIVEETFASSTSSAKNATRVDLDAFIEGHPSVSFAKTDALGLGREEVLDLLSSRTKAQRKGPLLSPTQCDALVGLIGQILDLRPGAASNLYKVLGQVKAELRTTPAEPPTPPLPAPRPSGPTPPTPHSEELMPAVMTPPPPALEDDPDMTQWQICTYVFPRDAAERDLACTETFDFSTPNEWPKWRKRFERYLVVSGMKKKEEADKIDLFMYLMGDRADDIFRTFKFEKEEEATKIDSVLKAFDSHFCVRKNIIYERAKFNSRIQEDREPVDEFITSLYKLANSCEFEGLHEQLIRDRIVVGVRDKALSERMQLDSELTLEKAVKLVRQQEAVRQQQVDLQRPSTSQKINQVKFNSKKQSPKQQQQPSRKKKSAKTRSRCPKCGGFTHREGQACRAEGQRCNLCSKTGHFANCCPDKQAKTAEVKAISELDEEIDFLLEVSAVEDSSNLDDDEGECRRRWTAEIQVNGKQDAIWNLTRPRVFSESYVNNLARHGRVICYLDDILIFASDSKTHDRILRLVLRKLKEAKVTLNKAKCVFGVPRINFLGHILDEDGIRPDPAKIEAVAEMPAPTDVHGVRRFLGMVNHLGRFVENLSEIVAPLNQLLVKGQDFVYDCSQERAFRKLKELLTTQPILAAYDVRTPTMVSSDASSYGLGAVLKQEGKNGIWRPVAYSSRTMTPTEKRYAQIEKEALAITWACERFQDFLLGKRFRIETDHKPLIPLFSTKELSSLTPRLQRFRMRMMRFGFEIVHTPGKELLDADALSRQPLLTTEGGDDERPTSAHINAVLSSITDKDEMLTKIFEAQQEDTTLKAVVNYLEQGWPDKKKMSQALLSYWHVKDELGVQNGLLMRSCRLVIPASMKLEILDKLHAGHFGITKTRLRARETVWWPGISEEIAETVRKCSVCIQEAVSKHEPLIPTNFPTRPWQKIGMDLFKFENKWYLVVIDYYSRFPEMVQLDRLTASVVVRSCKSIFARHGIPETVVSDNGTQFGAAREFANFARQYGFQHVTSSPRFPQSNGMAEAGVKIAKLILKKNQDPSLGLLEYRSTPLENGYSPAELLMGRKLRTTLPIAPENLNPRLVDSQTLKRKEGRRRKDMKSRYDRRCGATDMEELSEGDTVWITDMRTWGIVKQKASTPRSYIVDTPVGTLRRNRFHLRKGVTVQYPADPSTPTFSGEELVENEKTPVVDYPSNDSEDGQIRTR